MKILFIGGTFLAAVGPKEYDIEGNLLGDKVIETLEEAKKNLIASL